MAICNVPSDSDLPPSIIWKESDWQWLQYYNEHITNAVKTSLDRKTQ